MQEGRLGHRSSVIRERRNLDVDDREKMKGRDEYLNARSWNNNDNYLHWHAVWLSEETKLVSYHAAYHCISSCDGQDW